MSHPAAPISHRRPWATDRFRFGVCYYPEHWDEALRQGDPERMAAAGVNVVRMAEFAWDLMEPSEGRYDFALFERTLDRLHAHGIEAILCTPTATPPRWLTQAHPDLLRIDARGVRLEHGSRQHACTANPLFRRYSRSITAAMAQRFKDHPAVAGWQTDNELHCHFSECHCPACQDGFRDFLRRSHGTAEALNEAWGNAFWAQTVTSFEQVQTPRDGLPTYQNPGARLDYQRFLSAATTAFQREQIDILRAAQPRWFITHNGLFGNIDYRAGFAQDLDVLGMDLYPMFVRDATDRPASHALHADYARCLSGNFIVPEQQAGPGGQPGYLLDTPMPGEMRQLAYGSIARGADSLLFFRWRTCRFGAEEFWCGILDHDDVPRRRYRELAQLGAELKRVGPAVLGTSVRVDAAIAWGDFDAQAANATYPAGLPGDQGARDAVHRHLFDAGVAVGLVHPADDLAGVKLYWIPHWELVRPEWVPALERWVADGGVLVVGARCGTRDASNRMTAQTWPGCLRPLVGATVEEFGRINHPASRPLALRLGASAQPAEHWYEALAPDPGTEVVATWQGMHLDGVPAITRRRVGRGQAVYLGTWTTRATVAALMPALLHDAGISPLPGAAPGIQVVCREGGGRRIWFYLNHQDGPATVRLPEAGRELLADREVAGALELPRFGVAVVRS